MFRTEVEAVSALRHPNIVHVIEVGTMPEGPPFVVMELLEGRLLGERLGDVRTLDIGETSMIIKSIASALQAAHARGVVHREINPGNVFLAEAEGYDMGFVKLLNFGIARLRTAGGDIGFSTEAARYMSPEQAQGRTDEIDGRSDQFALAALAYRSLSGTDAFHGDDAISVLYQVVHEEPQPLGQLVEVNPEIDAVIQRGLSKHKTDRYDSVMGFARALESAVHEGKTMVTASVPAMPTPVPRAAAVAMRMVANDQTATPIDPAATPRHNAITMTGFEGTDEREPLTPQVTPQRRTQAATIKGFSTDQLAQRRAADAGARAAAAEGAESAAGGGAGVGAGGGGTGAVSGVTAAGGAGATSAAGTATGTSTGSTARLGSLSGRGPSGASILSADIVGRGPTVRARPPTPSPVPVEAVQPAAPLPREQGLTRPGRPAGATGEEPRVPTIKLPQTTRTKTDRLDSLITDSFFNKEVPPETSAEMAAVDAAAASRRPQRWRIPLFLVAFAAVTVVAALGAGWRPPLSWRQSDLWHQLNLPGAATPPATGEASEPDSPPPMPGTETASGSATAPGEPAGAGAPAAAAGGGSAPALAPGTGLGPPSNPAAAGAGPGAPGAAAPELPSGSGSVAGGIPAPGGLGARPTDPPAGPGGGLAAPAVAAPRPGAGNAAVVEGGTPAAGAKGASSGAAAVAPAAEPARKPRGRRREALEGLVWSEKYQRLVPVGKENEVLPPPPATPPSVPSTGTGSAPPAAETAPPPVPQPPPIETQPPN